MMGPRGVIAELLAIALLATIIRLLLIPRQSLWADEVFSLAMATGHSLEQPASQSQPSRGDYVEMPKPQPPDFYRAYMREDRPIPLSSVTRAVMLSDTNPPFYYILLHGWTKLLGTSDYSLRLLSVLWSLASLPLIFMIGRRVGGTATGVTACLLFSIAPSALFYSTEGRMYSLVWLLTAGYVYQLLQLYDGRVRWWSGITLAVLVGAIGLLTHYFFLFPWLACTLWLLIVDAGVTSRWNTLTILPTTALLVWPWYSKLPASLGEWRITKDWLNLPSGNWAGLTTRFPHATWLATPIYLAQSFFSLRGPWTGSERVAWLIALNFLVLALVIVVFGIICFEWHRSFFTGGRGLLWVWFATPCLGPLCFDLVRHTYTGTVPRYALAGLPAAMLLLALCLAHFSWRGREGLIGAILLLWAVGDWQIFSAQYRYGEPFNEIAQRINAESPQPDIIVVHSIPSGILALARYLKNDVPIFSWVEQLHQRSVSGDLAHIVKNRHSVTFIKIHFVGESAPEESWLMNHTSNAYVQDLGDAKLETFGIAPSPDHRIIGETPMRW